MLYLSSKINVKISIIMGNTTEKTSLVDPSRTELLNIKTLGNLLEFQFIKDVQTNQSLVLIKTKYTLGSKEQ